MNRKPAPASRSSPPPGERRRLRRSLRERPPGWLPGPVTCREPAYPRYNPRAGEGRCPFEPRHWPPRGCCAPLRTLGQGWRRPWTRALPRPSRCDARPAPTSTPGDTLPSPSDSPMRGYSPALNTVDKWWGVPLFRCPVRASRRVGMCTSRTPSPGVAPVHQSRAGRPSSPRSAVGCVRAPKQSPPAGRGRLRTRRTRPSGRASGCPRRPPRGGG